MNTIEKTVQIEQTIQKSQFICTLAPIHTIEEFQEVLASVKIYHPNASHHCYAYILGDTGEIAKFSDDGEPNQTAGIVIYEVLRKNHLTNISAIVTRYFGGIKLGAGGLIRAYSSSTRKALDEANIMEIIHYKKLIITLSYDLLSVVQKYMINYELLEKDFTSKILLVYKLPEFDIERMKEQLIESTNNAISISIDSL